MIPFSDQPGERRRRFPLVMIVIMIANVLVFLYEVGLGPAEQRFILRYGVIPYEISTGRDIAPGIPYPVYVTLLSSMFLHANLLHIAGNMLFLWVFGDNVEDRLGHFGFLIFYLACGVIAGLSQVAIGPSSRIPGIGASGAIAGVLAAYLLLFPRANVRTLVLLGPFLTVTRLSAILLIGLWILLQVVSGLFSLSGDSGGVAYWAHIGGFLAGLVIIWIRQGLRLTGV